MSKSGLGRGLGDLMGSQKTPASLEKSLPAAEKPETVVPSTAAPVESNPGLGTLLRGKQEEKHESNPFTEQTAAPQPPVTWMLLKWSLVAADILMLVPTSVFVLTRKTPLNRWEILLCIITFAFGATLGCLAFAIHQYEKKK